MGHLYLLRHSPEFNSIGNVVSKLKSKLRYATERTIAVLPYVRGKVTPVIHRNDQSSLAANASKICATASAPGSGTPFRLRASR